MAKTNEKEERGNVKTDNKPGNDHEMPRAQKAGGRSPMVSGPKMTPGNKRVAAKKSRY